MSDDDMGPHARRTPLLDSERAELEAKIRSLMADLARMEDLVGRLTGAIHATPCIVLVI